MKNFQAVLVAALLMVMLFGCSQLNNPVAPARDAAVTPALTSSIIPLPVVLQRLPPPISGRQKLVSATGTITASKGGIIQLSYAYWSILGKCDRAATLTVPPGAVNKDVYVTMSFDTTVVGVRFSPEGLVFNIPATIDFFSYGLDLSNILGQPFNLYYDDEHGYFERELAINVLDLPIIGTITCSKGQIPHFSRYAFGR